MKTFRIEVTHTVDVTMDETKFTPEFIKNFQEYMFQAESLPDHAEHLACLYVTGRAYPDKFVEGYGVLKDMGVDFNEVNVTTDDITDLK